MIKQPHNALSTTQTTLHQSVFSQINEQMKQMHNTFTFILNLNSLWCVAWRTYCVRLLPFCPRCQHHKSGDAVLWAGRSLAQLGKKWAWKGEITSLESPLSGNILPLIFSNDNIFIYIVYSNPWVGNGRIAVRIWTQMTFCVEPDRLYFTLRSFPRTYGKVIFNVRSFFFCVYGTRRTQEANRLIAYVPRDITQPIK